MAPGNRGHWSFDVRVFSIMKVGRKSFLGTDLVPVLGLGLSPIFITTSLNFDPINLPRLLLISSLAGLAMFLLSMEFKNRPLASVSKEKVVFLALVATFVLTIFNSWFFSGADIARQFYGKFGRNNGVLAYIGLSVILVSSSFARRANRGQLLMMPVFIGGILNLIYGYVQLLGFDPINWQNPYGPVVGTLGNPNFLSSFLAIFSLFIASRILFATTLFSWGQVPLLLLFAANQYLIWATGSIQGTVLVLMGIAILLALRFKLLLNTNLLLLIVSTAIFVLSFVLRGLLGEGPLGKYLYQSTLEVRTFFWSAAARMLLEKPIHGFGIDTFGDWYRRYRSEYASQFSGDISGDSAHNLPLDFAAWGGVPLLFSWILLVCFVFWKTFRFVRRNIQVDSDLAFLIVAWMCYLLQSLISINQLVLALYGFTLTGLLCSRIMEDPISTFASRPRKIRQPIKALLALLLGAFTAIPAVKLDIEFRQALANQEGSRLISVATSWPKNESYMIFAAEILVRSGYEKEAVDLSREALQINPQSLGALKIIYQSTITSADEKSFALKEIKFLDPWLWRNWT